MLLVNCRRSCDLLMILIICGGGNFLIGSSTITTFRVRIVSINLWWIIERLNDGSYIPVRLSDLASGLPFLLRWYSTLDGEGNAICAWDAETGSIASDLLICDWPSDQRSHMWRLSYSVYNLSQTFRAWQVCRCWCD